MLQEIVRLPREGSSVKFANKRWSILIADDDDAWRMTLSAILVPDGYETIEVASGSEAIQIVEHRLVDCVLLDFQMPGLSGIETLRMIRGVRSSLPCILMTAETSPNVVEQALSLRAYTVLHKPVSRAQVTTTIREALVGDARHA